MVGTYDIFKKEAGHTIWVEAVEGLEQAKQRLSQYRRESEEEFLVWDANHGTFVDVLTTH